MHPDSVHLFFFFAVVENTSIKGLSQAEEKAQRYYQACMNEDKIEKLGAKPLQDLISDVCHSHICRFTSPKNPLSRLFCIPLFVCLNTDSDRGMGSDGTLGQGQLPGSVAHCVGQLSHFAIFQCVCQH